MKRTSRRPYYITYGRRAVFRLAVGDIEAQTKHTYLEMLNHGHSLAEAVESSSCQNPAETHFVYRIPGTRK